MVSRESSTKGWEHQVGVAGKGYLLKVQFTGSLTQLQCIFLMLQSSVSIPGFSDKRIRNTSLKKKKKNWPYSSVQSCELCDPMDRSTPGLPVHHQLLKSTQIHVHWVGDAIQPSHPLSSPSAPALNLSQHRGLFKWVSSSHQVAKVLEFQLQHKVQLVCI